MKKSHIASLVGLVLCAYGWRITAWFLFLPLALMSATTFEPVQLLPGWNIIGGLALGWLLFVIGVFIVIVPVLIIVTLGYLAWLAVWAIPLYRRNQTRSIAKL